MYVAILALFCWLLTSNYIFLIAALVLFVLGASGRREWRGGFRQEGESENAKNWVDSLSLVDPRFNMREAAKQMILLEDHLFHSNKHCLDCISKHTLFAEGLLEEAITMDKSGTCVDLAKRTLSQLKELMPPLIKKMKDKTVQEGDFKAAADQLRAIRKPIARGYSYFE